MPMKDAVLCPTDRASSLLGAGEGPPGLPHLPLQAPNPLAAGSRKVLLQEVESGEKVGKADARSQPSELLGQLLLLRI